MRFAILLLSGAILSACAPMADAGESPPAASSAVSAITAAITDPLRPEADVARDAARKPAEIVAFSGVTEGARIAELAPGGGYYTRILARAVGPEGHVYALVPPFFANRPGGLDAINTLAAQYGNVTVVVADFAQIQLPEKVDLVWTTENYHDFNNGPAGVAPLNASVHAALKPGGIFFVEDHEAAPGSGTSATNTLHRIDPEAVVAQVAEAGFTLDARSDALKNPADPLTVGPREVAGPGVSSKFALRFRKPE